jgi:hypothetical protein
MKKAARLHGLGQAAPATSTFPRLAADKRSHDGSTADDGYEFRPAAEGIWWINADAAGDHG